MPFDSLSARRSRRANALRIRLDSLEDRTTPAVGTVQFQSGVGGGAEGSSPTVAIVLVTDNFDLNGPVSADIATTGGTATSGADFTPFPTTTVTFANGDPFTIVGGSRVYTKTANLALIDDQRVEPSETVVFGVSNVVLGGADGIALGSPIVHTFTITDNDSAVVTYSGTAGVTEGGGPADVTATLSFNTTGTGAIGLDTPVSTTVTSATADFTAATATWAVGESGAKPVAVTATDDRLVEAATESLTGTISVTTLATVTTAGTAAVNVTDNDSATVVITTPGTTTVTEGGAGQDVGVTLTLNALGTGPIELAVPLSATLPGNSDYAAAAATFNPGAASGATGNVTVTAVNDQTVEAQETFSGQALSVSTAATATATGSQTVVVNDNDSASVAITGGTTSVTEGGSAVDVVATLTLTTNGTGTVELGVPVSVSLPGNADYTATAATFAAGLTTGATANVSVSAVNDLLIEATTETFANQALTVTAANGATVTATGAETVVVTDNDTANVALTTPGTTSVAEGGASQNVNVTLTLTANGTAGAGTLDVTVAANLPGNADYTSTAFTFAAGATSGATGDVVVAAVDDRLIEAATETFTGQALAVTTAATATATGSQTVEVTDNDSASVAVAAGTTTVAEGGAAQDVAVTLTLAATGTGPIQLAVPVSVNLPGNADYSAVTATFPVDAQSGDTANVSVSAVNDQLVEATTESFPGQALTVTAANGATVTATGTRTVDVTDNDSASVGVPTATTTVAEGASQNVTATLTLTTNGTGAAELAVPVSVNLPGNADYTAGTVTFNAGATSGNTLDIAVGGVDDQLVEGPETFADQNLTLVSGGGASVAVTGTQSIVVTDNDSATVTIANGTTAVTEGGASVVLTATLALTTSGTGPAALADLVVFGLPGNADYTSSLATFSAGATTGAAMPVFIDAVDDRLVEATTETFADQALTIVSLPNPAVTAVGTQTIEVTDNDSASVAVTAPGTTTVAEGGAAQDVGVILTLTASGAGPIELAVPVSVSLPGNGDYAAAAATFAAGALNAATANVSVSGIDDQRVEPTETFAGQALAVTNANGANVTASGSQTVVVTDNDSATITVSTATTTVAEGGTAQNVIATLTLTTPGSVGTPGLDVDISAALPGNADYTAPAVTFVAGSAGGDTQPIVVTAVDDQAVEAATESFTGQALAITANNGATATAAGAQTIAVTDNDSAGVAITTPGATTVAEGGATQPVNVTLTLTTTGTGPVSLDVPVAATLPGNADYTAAPAVFAPGSASGATADLSITATNDQFVEGTETFANQALQAVTPATATATGDQTVVVTDNDTATVSVAAGTTAVTEGAAGVPLTVTLNLTTSGTGTVALAGPVSVSLPGNADYTATAATFNAGATTGDTATLTVTAVDDQAVETFTETFAGQALAVTSGTAAAAGTRTVTVTDNDKARVTYSGTAALTEGDPAAATVTATLSLVTTGTGPVQLDTPVSATVTSPTNDFTAATVTWAAGATPGAQDIAVTVIDDRIVEHGDGDVLGARRRPGRPGHGRRGEVVRRRGDRRGHR
ncbi:MAG TPA: Calx-beta domain-containing protein, partial [Gemmataceae bacterium]|nr:Calx-beta domain-containing protein [Gemmataceae bacterium]